MELRWYQREAVEAVYRFLREHDGNPVVVLPVGSGKSVVIAQIAIDTVRRWDGRILAVTHSRELVEQNADKIRRFAPGIEVGVYCAALRRRDIEPSVLCASIQSIYQRACELGPFDLVVVDEAHCIPAEGEGRYRKFLAEAKVVNPRLRICGTTATPYRLSSGPICHPEGILNEICYEVGLRELISQGYLSPLISKAGLQKVDISQLHVRGGEFVAEETERLMDDAALVEAACTEIVEYTSDRNACLIFSTGVAHGRHIAEVLEEKHGLECGFVSAETPTKEREELLARFRGEAGSGLFERQPLKYLVNCAIMTTGVDIPRLDAIAILRPTMSPGLLVQMIGRGTRLHPGKQNCLILDYGSNIERHGPIDQIKVPDPKSKGSGAPAAKECPECHALMAAGYSACPDCGHLFSAREKANHDAEASTEGVLSGEVITERYRVRDVNYRVHTKRGADEDAPKTMRVDYRIGLARWVSEWVCFEHSGYARWKAEQWWLARSRDPIPDTAQRAVDIANGGGVCWTESIIVRSVTGEAFERVVDYELGEKPEAVPAEEVCSFDDDDIPF